MIQNSGLKRNPIDKFYTIDSVVKECCQQVSQNLIIDPKNDLIIEPSAGCGAFIQTIKTLCENTMFYDIEPESPLITKCDFLQTNLTESQKTHYKSIHVIGNPPFGRQSSLAIKFIKHATKFCDSLSFILPKSFKKDSMKKKIPLDFHCIFEEDIRQNAFTRNNNPFHVPCIFQIWKKMPFPRILPPVMKPLGFQFVKKHEFPDISFRRVGVNAGKIDSEITTKSTQSHYFIKFTNELTDQKKEQLKQIQFKSSENTVGPKSISKQELIKEFNTLLVEVKEKVKVE